MKYCGVRDKGTSFRRESYQVVDRKGRGFKNVSEGPHRNNAWFVERNKGCKQLCFIIFTKIRESQATPTFWPKEHMFRDLGPSIPQDIYGGY